MRNLMILAGLLVSPSSFAIFGMEIGPLLQLVAGQAAELERLAQMAGSAKDQMTAIRTLNEGIDRTVQQIESVEAIIERAQGLSPSSLQSIRELNEYLERVHEVRERADQIMGIRVKAAELAISQSSLQGDTAYKMGQEMIGTGSSLAVESRQASPGRAAQISASSSSAQMMAKGVELQTMAQLVQLQAVSLDLQRSQIEQEIRHRKASQNLFMSTLQSTIPKKRRPQ